MTAILYTGIALASAIITFLFCRFYFGQKISFLQYSQDELKKLLQVANVEKEKKQSQKEALLAERARLQEEVKNLLEKMQTQKLEVEQLGDRFKFEFRNLAQSILDEKTEKFTQVNEHKMNEIINPLKIQLVEFKQKVEDTYDKESKGLRFESSPCSLKIKGL